MSNLVEENVQDYPRPPRLEPFEGRIQVTFAGRVIVDTTAGWRVLETHHAPTYYLPPESVEADLLPAGGGSLCEWKGRAEYFSIKVGTAIAPQAAWQYARPTKAFESIAGYLAIYAHAMDAVSVAGVPVTPQPGSFYGGWVTPNLRGTVKGAPGTEGW